jgi:outer membrane protein, heavy metal efflux system
MTGGITAMACALLLVNGTVARSAEIAPGAGGSDAVERNESSAAGGDSLHLHLEDAVKLALARNWDLRSARNDVAQAEAGRTIARAFPNPSASALTSKIPARGAGTDATTSGDVWSRPFDTVLGVSQLVEIGGKRSNRQASATQEWRAARARWDDTRRNLIAAVTRTYVAAALADANANIGLESAASLNAEAKIAALRFEAGDISASDRDQIEIAAARLEVSARNAESSAREQRLSLEVLLGLANPGGKLVVSDSLESLADRALRDSVATAVGERADLAAARASLAKANADLNLQRAQRIPDPTLGFQYEHEPPDQPNTLGFGVSFPLPLWNRNSGAIVAAEAARDQAARDVQRVEAGIAAEIAIARTAYGEAAARWQRYRDEVRPRSAHVRDSVSHAYERGGASLLDLLQAARNDNDVRLATVQAAGDVVVAAATLRAATQNLAGEDALP